MPIVGARGLALLVAASLSASNGRRQADRGWTARFLVDRSELRSSGRNPYFILEPGYQLVLEGSGTRLTITVLAETRMVDGVETRVVEEREVVGGVLKEISRNFFAISARTNSVFYFGEEVAEYERGRVVGHEGAWLSGIAGARSGLLMPGLPLLHARYYEEIAPRVAMDRAEIVNLDGTLSTPAGRFSDVLTIEETTPLEPNARETKRYAPGVGLIQDGDLKLVRHGAARAAG
jgi:hypothetical protein